MFAPFFFTGLAAAGIAACFALGVTAPVLHALGILRARLVLRRQGAAGRSAPRLSEHPVRLELSAAHRRFAADTRSLLVDLEHAGTHPDRVWDEHAAAWWHRALASLSDSAYAPTLGITGDVWRWLRQAEALLDDESEPAGPSLDSVTTAVRAMLFDGRPLSTQLDGLATLVARVDAGLRADGGAPYRDRLPPTFSPVGAAKGAESGAAEAQRREHYREALRLCGSAVSMIVQRYAQPRERDDLSQEIWLAVWNALGAYREDCSLRTYVLRIARYRAITFRDRRLVLEGEREWPDGAPAPDELLEEKRQRRALGRAITQLPSKLRLALEMRLEGFTYREIAQRLAITEKNASVRVSRARQAVRRSLCVEPS